MQLSILKNLFILILISTVFSTSFSCKSRTGKKIISTNTIQINNLIDSINFYNFGFKTYNFKTFITVEQEESSYSASCHIRIKKDSAIWISIMPVLGIEVFRICLTPDSVKYLNRLDNTFYAGNYIFLHHKMNLDFGFYTIQNVLLNQLFTYPEGKPIQSYWYSIVDNLHLLQSEKDTAKVYSESNSRSSTSPISNEISIDPLLYRVNKLSFVDFVLKRTFTLKYLDFLPVNSKNNKLFPFNAIITLNNNSKKYIVNLKINKAAFDDNLDFPFRIPDKYREIY